MEQTLSTHHDNSSSVTVRHRARTLPQRLTWVGIILVSENVEISWRTQAEADAFCEIKPYHEACWYFRCRCASIGIARRGSSPTRSYR